MIDDFKFILSIFNKHSINTISKIDTNIIRIAICGNIEIAQVYISFSIQYSDSKYYIDWKGYSFASNNIRMIAAYILNAYRSFFNG